MKFESNMVEMKHSSKKLGNMAISKSLKYH